MLSVFVLPLLKVQDNSTEKLISQGDLQPQKPLLANMVNFGLKFPTVARLPTGSHTAAAHEVIMRNGVISENVNFAGIIPQTEVQSNKPSGLRMPSPSLSFFSQVGFKRSMSCIIPFRCIYSKKVWCFFLEI